MRLLRTNNEFKLRVLIYRGFTVLLILFLKFSVSKSLFLLILYKFLFILQEICPKLNAEILSEEMQKRPPMEIMTVRRACEGP